MEKISRSHKKFCDAYKALTRSMTLKEQISTANDILADTIVAGIIKHFEFAYETAWKFLKEHLEAEFNEQILSPKAVFRACKSRGLLSEKTVECLIALADDRNLTTHIYDQITALEILEAIESHYEALGVVLNSIKPDQNK
jgi:nucleotidyltransferase substrate binding protein (TIGR01987 family)